MIYFSEMNVPTFRIKNLNETFFNVTWDKVISSKYGSVVFIEFRKEGMCVKQNSIWKI